MITVSFELCIHLNFHEGSTTVLDSSAELFLLLSVAELYFHETNYDGFRFMPTTCPDCDL